VRKRSHGQQRYYDPVPNAVVQKSLTEICTNYRRSPPLGSCIDYWSSYESQLCIDIFGLLAKISCDGETLVDPRDYSE
jgi:hypothetical protein